MFLNSISMHRYTVLVFLSGLLHGGREDQPHVQGAMAAQAQEGLEELSQVKGQEGRR